MTYTTNDLTELKREALCSMDIDTLRLIKDHEAFKRNQVFYFARIDENCLRDAAGNIVDLTTLPAPRYTTFERYASMAIGTLSEELEEKPGDLYRCLQSDLEDKDRLSLLILELPETATFPLPEGFNWSAWIDMITQHIKATGYVPDYSLRHKFNGTNPAFNN